MLRARRAFGVSRPVSPPDPEVAAHTALSELDGWLAARILSSGHMTLPPDRAAALERATGGQARIRASARPHLPSLDRISAAFDLDGPERDLLLAAALVEASPAAARLIAMLGEPGASRRMVLGQLAELGHEPSDFLARLRPDAPIVDFGLVALKGDGPLVTRELAVPPDVTAAALDLRGAPALPLRVMGDEDRCRPLPPRIVDRVAALTRMLALREMPGAPFIIVTGTPDSGRRDIARSIAASLRPIAVETPLAELIGAECQVAFRRTVRMNDAVAILSDPQDAEGIMLSAVLRGLDGPVIAIAPAGSSAAIAAQLDRPAISLDVPRSDVAERAELWR